MLLGKRPRPPIKRTTSMTGITVDLTNVESQEPSDIQNPMKDPCATLGPEGSLVHHHNMNGYDHSVLAMVSPRNYSRRNSGDIVETAHFLRTCGLCNCRLAPGKDIYMYRGDTAFCSSECREQQIKQDERKEKCKVVASSKKQNHHASPPRESSKGSSKSETMAAA